MKSNLSKTAFLFGTIFGTLMILEFLISYHSQIDPIKEPFWGILMQVSNYILLPIGFIIFACLQYKKRFNNGFLSFSEVLRIGIITTITAAFISSIFNLIYFNFAPDVVNNIINEYQRIAMHQREVALAQGATTEEIPTVIAIQENIKQTRSFMTSFFSVPFTMIIYAGIGAIVSLIVSVFIKKDKPYTNQPL